MAAIPVVVRPPGIAEADAGKRGLEDVLRVVIYLSVHRVPAFFQSHEKLDGRQYGGLGHAAGPAPA